MRRLIIALASILFAYNVAQARDVMTIGRDAFFLDQEPQLQLFGKQVELEDEFAENPEQELASGFVTLGPDEKMPFVFRQARGLGNAFATIWRGRRLIVVDPDWYQDVDYLAGRAGTIGHEIGHHMCGHTVGVMVRDPWRKELEADRYEGAALRHAFNLSANSGMLPAFTFQDVLDATRRMLPVSGSPTHPPLEQRLAAIVEGYNHGSPCENGNFVQRETYSEIEKQNIELEAAREKDRWCLELARAFCSATTIEEKKFKHSLLHDNCDVLGAFSYRHSALNKLFIAFPGVDCVAGGRYAKRGVNTNIQIGD